MIKELCRPIVHSNYSIQQWKVILDPNPLLEQQNCDLLSTPPRPPILSPQEDEGTIRTLRSVHDVLLHSINLSTEGVNQNEHTVQNSRGVDVTESVNVR